MQNVNDFNVTQFLEQDDSLLNVSSDILDGIRTKVQWPLNLKNSNFSRITKGQLEARELNSKLNLNSYKSNWYEFSRKDDFPQQNHKTIK